MTYINQVRGTITPIRKHQTRLSRAIKEKQEQNQQQSRKDSESEKEPGRGKRDAGNLIDLTA